MMSRENLENSLAQFYGSENFYRYGPRLILTDGIKFLADNAECYWLIDIVASILPKMIKLREDFLSCHLEIKDNRGFFFADDGNGKVLYRQDIEFSDFPLEKFEFFVSSNGEYYTMLLKSEY